MGSLDNKIALVTGAGQGVGRGIALALAAEGATIAVVGRTAAKLEDTAGEIARRGGKATTVVCDVGDGEAIDACVAQVVADHGTVDILVNNAQVVPLGKLLEVKERAFEAGFRTGPIASLRFMQRCHEHLAGGGSVVNLGSGAGLRPDPVGLGAYAAVKEATRSLTRAAAVEWGPDGIRVNAIIPIGNSPGMEMWGEFFPDDYKAFMKTVPLGRLGDCEQDVGKAVAWLASDAASYITGTTLMLDGGQAYLR
jgi:meso-butanediol dehydrogenase/(S,S)-butanediol dehydrogenase/diacetyl reductase